MSPDRVPQSAPGSVRASRMEAFSDGVFSIAATLLVLAAARHCLSAISTRLVAEALHGPNDERVFVTVYGLTLLTIRLLITALDAHSRHEHLYAEGEAAEELQTERRQLWPVLTAYGAVSSSGSPRRPQQWCCTSPWPCSSSCRSETCDGSRSHAHSLPIGSC